MSLLSKKAVVLLLAAAATVGVLNVQAATVKEAPPQKVSMLDGKFTFTLPKGFVASQLPSNNSASGTMYANEATKTVVIAAQNSLPEGTTVKDNDGAFLDGTVADFDAAQRKSLKDYNKLSEKSLTLKSTGLGVRQVDSTATQGGGLTLNTTLMAASGSRMTVIQVISRPGDMAAHETLIKQIVSGK